MSDTHRPHVTRREFVQRSGLLAGGVLLGGVSQAAARPAGSSTFSDTIPRRVLGRTGESLTTMTLGTAPCGLSPKIPPIEIAKIVNAAIDMGINSIDTAPAYQQSEEGIGIALGTRRKDIFLATKVMADDIEDAEKSLAESFRLVKTDWFDLVYYHSAGDRDIERGMQPGGVFDWLIKQKQAGKFRFLGISGHNRPHKFLPLLETGEVDVLLAVINFVDRYTYNFEETVLPVARKHDVGIVAMKVFGGARKSAGSYENPQAPPEMDVEYLSRATRYALDIPGVHTLNLGVHNIDQVRHNLELVKQYTPLTDDEQQELAQLGKKWAAQWGEHFGAVA